MGANSAPYLTLTGDNMKIFLAVLIVAAFVFFVPIAAIDSVNILFNTQIPFTFSTWVSALMLIGIIYGGPK